MEAHLVAQAFERNLPSWSILVFLGTAIVVTVCRKQPEKSAEPLEKVLTAHSAILHTDLFHIALTKGFFPLKILEVAPQPHPIGKVALGAGIQEKTGTATLARWTSETKPI
jgi:hypothetical protein